MKGGIFLSVHSTKGLDPHLGDIFSGAIVVLLGLVLRFWAIPRYIKYNIKVAVLAPESFPAAFSLMLILLGVILLTQGWLQYRTKKLVHKAEGQSSELKKITMKPVSFVVLLVAFIYVNLLYPIGYPLATVLLIVVLFKFLGGKKMWQGILLGICTSAATWWFFRIYLMVALPSGRIW
jgi:hypothetical protein